MSWLGAIVSAVALINGWKTYAAALIGAVVILLHHFAGIEFPGVKVDDANWLGNLFGLVLVITGRHALGKG